MGNFVFKLPDIGEGVVEGEVVQWHVSVGDSVSEDDPIVDVMTDKATVTIPSPVSGVISSLSGDVGDMIAVGSSLMEIDSEGEGGAQRQKIPRSKSRFRILILPRHPSPLQPPRHPSPLQPPRHPSPLQPPRHPSLPLQKSKPKQEEFSPVLRSERERARMM
ncbi:MAG: hypothetical protein Ct9H90mP24_4490 [Methanobacteriota archaeon]|nr:MAG: hypothetical protein Ct9H90mP24_4490 [Euryarchaeota archaeon]